MRPRHLLVPLLVAALAACATTETTSGSTAPASNPMTGANARPNPSPLAIGAYSAIGTSDDVRGRSGAGGSSVLTGRANLAGSDSGTTPTSSKEATSEDSSKSDSATPPRP